MITKRTACRIKDCEKKSMHQHKELMVKAKIAAQAVDGSKTFFIVGSLTGEAKSVIYYKPKEAWSCTCEGNSVYLAECYHIKAAKLCLKNAEVAVQR